MSRDDSLSRQIAGDKRRKRRNLVATHSLDQVPAPSIPPDVPGPPSTPSCGGGLLSCPDLAGAEDCSPSSGGSWSNVPTCAIDLLSAGMSEGQRIAWAADVKNTAAAEINPAGTLKMSSDGFLLRDDLSTLDNVTVEAGTPEIVGGKLRVPADCEVRFTGISARSEIVSQVTKRATTWQDHHFVGRCTAGLNGYSVQQNQFDDTMWEILAAAENGQLGSNPYVPGWPDYQQAFLKIHVADGVQRGRIGADATSQSYDFETADTDRDTETGTTGLVPDPSVPSVGIYWNLLQCPSDTITCDGLETGYSIRVGTLTATESSGTATLDLEGTFYPATRLDVLNASGVAVASISPAIGFGGGATFTYDITGALTAAASVTQVDLDFLASGGSLISTATWGVTWNRATYQRLTGVATIPVGTRSIVPTHRRTGAGTAVSCARRFVVVPEGQSTAWVPCTAAETPATAHVVPTDEAKVMDLRFTNKYPKVDSTTSGFGAGTPKADADGTIALSRRIFDASIHRLHWHLVTDSHWSVGPGGDVTDPNPLGDWVADWPQPVPGIRGWARWGKVWGDWYALGIDNPGGTMIYDAPDVASIRGPNGEFNQMDDFTYIFWWTPSLETYWDHNFASMFSPSATEVHNPNGGGETFRLEQAGWRFYYTFRAGDDEPHTWRLVLNTADGYREIRWGSADGGRSDPMFGGGVDDSLWDIGEFADAPAFIALRLSKQGTPPVPFTAEHEGAGGASVFVDGTTEYAHSFVAPADGVVTHVAMRMRQGDATTYQDDAFVRMHLLDDDSGSPGASTSLRRGFGSVGAMPDSASSPVWVTVTLNTPVPVVSGSTYWIVVEGSNEIDGTHRVEVFGTDPGDDAGGASKSGAVGGAWSAASIDLDYRADGYEQGDGVTADVWLGNPRTGTLRRFGAADLLDLNDDWIVPNTDVAPPLAFTAQDNTSHPVVGNLSQSRYETESLEETFFGAIGGILSVAIRHNRALADVEIAGAFVAGSRHEYEAASSLFEADVDSSGESADIVEAP